MPHTRPAVQSLSPSGEIPQRIIEAATEVFAVHGYQGARVRDVVRLADVNLAAVNYYFGGKEGLYAATITELASARVLLKPRDDDDQDAVALMQEHITAMLRRSMEGGASTKLSRILAHESMDPTPYFDRMMMTAVGPEFERLVQLVGRIATTPLSDHDASVLALSIMGQCYFYLFAGPAVKALLKGDYPGTPESLAVTVTRIAVSSIRDFQAEDKA